VAAPVPLDLASMAMPPASLARILAFTVKVLARMATVCTAKRRIRAVLIWFCNSHQRRGWGVWKNNLPSRRGSCCARSRQYRHCASDHVRSHQGHRCGHWFQHCGLHSPGDGRQHLRQFHNDHSSDDRWESQCDPDPHPELESWWAGGTYNNHPIGVYYNGAKWTIFNQDLGAMPVNAAFNVLIVKP